MRRWLLGVAVCLACTREPGPECKALVLERDDFCAQSYAGEGVFCDPISKIEIDWLAKKGPGLEAERECHQQREGLRSFAQYRKTHPWTAPTSVPTAK